ncbi:MAG: hypothetical protein JXB24_06725 [Bacteroidales bacterium]|nr:hypothetical protein [Bacteroidales bacterium]
MKKLFLLLSILFCACFLKAQDDEVVYHDSDEEFRTIFGGKKVGGYGGIGLGYSQIDDKHAFVFDARGGVVLGHHLAMGFGGAGFINSYEYNLALNKDVSLVGGYGGLFIEPIVFPNSSIHLSFPVLFGVGGAAYTSFVREEDNEYEQNNNVEETSVFMLIEPAVELEFNLTKFMRMAGFFSYRFTNDLDIEYVQADALTNFSAGVRFKFGKF